MNQPYGTNTDMNDTANVVGSYPTMEKFVFSLCVIFAACNNTGPNKLLVTLYCFGRHCIIKYEKWKNLVDLFLMFPGQLQMQIYVAKIFQGLSYKFCSITSHIPLPNSFSFELFMY